VTVSNGLLPFFPAVLIDAARVIASAIGFAGRKRRVFRARKKPTARLILTFDAEFLLVAG
jgi:hypothetical protein